MSNLNTSQAVRLILIGNATCLMYVNRQMCTKKRVDVFQNYAADFRGSSVAR